MVAGGRYRLLRAASGLGTDRIVVTLLLLLSGWMAAIPGPRAAEAAPPVAEACFPLTDARAKPGKVRLTWPHQDGTIRYDIHRSAASNPTSFAKIDETTSTVSKYLDKTVANKVAYLYLVEAVFPEDRCFSEVRSAYPTRSRRPPNVDPIIYSVPIPEGTMEVIYNYDVNATDPNGDSVSFSLTQGPAGMTVDPATGLIGWTPATAGNFEATVEVGDGRGGSATQTFTVSVTELPTEPVPVPVPDAVGLSQAEAEAEIVAAGLGVGVVSTANSNTVPAGDVISQQPAAGTEITQGTGVDLVVSLGPAMSVGITGEVLENDAEKAAFCGTETVLGIVMDVIEKKSCASVAGNYEFDLSADEDGNTFVVYDNAALTGEIVKSNTKGEKISFKNSGSGDFDNVGVDRVASACANDRDGAIIFGGGLARLEGDKYGWVFIKDLYRDQVNKKPYCTGDSCAQKEGAKGYGFEGATKQVFPRSKWVQFYRYRRPNGQDGGVFVLKKQIARNKAPKCKIIINADADDIGNGLDVFGLIKVRTCNKSGSNCKDLP